MNNKRLIVIFLIVFIDLIGFGILIPVLPLYATKQFGSNEFEIGIMISIFSFFQFIFNPILGSISDKFGRKIVLTTSLLITTVSYVIFAYAENYYIALMARAMAGVGGGSLSTAQAYISDVTDKTNRAKGMGLIGAAFGLGFVFGPLIGGWLSHISMRTPSLASAAFSFFALILTIIILDETVVKSSSKKDLFSNLNFNNYKIAFTNKISANLILIFFLITFSIANTYGVLPLLGMKKLNLNEAQVGHIYGIIGIISIFIQGYFLKILLKYFSERTLLSSGFIFSAAGLILVPFANDFLIAIAFLIIMSLGTALMTPILLGMISKFTPPDQQGAVLGVNQSLGSLGRVLGPLWGGFTYKYFSYFTPFITAGFFTIIAFFIEWLKLKNVLSKNVTE